MTNNLAIALIFGVLIVGAGVMVQDIWAEVLADLAALVNRIRGR